MAHPLYTRPRYGRMAREGRYSKISGGSLAKGAPNGSAVRQLIEQRVSPNWERPESHHLGRYGKEPSADRRQFAEAHQMLNDGNVLPQ
jgi:hypothetical protein